MQDQADQGAVKRSSGKTWAWVLGLGCGIPVLMVVLAIAAFILWALLPGEQAPTPRLVNLESAAYLHLRDVGDDPGASALSERVVREMLRVAAETDKNEGATRRLQAQSGSAAGISRFALPRAATLVWDPAIGRGQMPVVAANFRYLVRPAKKFLNFLAQTDPQIEHRPEEGPEGLYLFAESPWVLAPLAGSFVASSAPHAALTGAQRLQGEDPAAAVQERIEAGAGPWHLHGWMRPSAFAGSGPLEQFLPGTLLDEVFFGVNALSQDALEAQIVLDATNPSTAESLEKAASLALMMIVGQAQLSGLSVEHSHVVEEDEIIYTLEVHGLDAALTRAGDMYIAAAAAQSE